MKEIQDSLKHAFAEIHAPEEVKQQTLAAIEARRNAEAQKAADAMGAWEANTSATTNDFTTTLEENTLAQTMANCASAPSNVVPFPKSKRTTRRTTIITSIAACLLMICVGVSLVKAFPPEGGQSTQQPIEIEEAVQAPKATPAAFVGIDINPSLEFAVDESGNVIEVEALNTDADAILASTELVNLTYEQALNNLIANPNFDTYLTKNALLEVNVSSDNQALSQQLTAQSDAALARLGCETLCLQTDIAHHQAAADAGMGMGKYRAATELMGLDSSITLEDCSNMTIRELHDSINAHHANDTASQRAQHNSSSSQPAHEAEPSHSGGNASSSGSGSSENAPSSGSGSRGNGHNNGGGHNRNSGHE